ncbi:hypothetical protein ASE01_09310 [Nocardioides sp. Root190]|uniref:hypothetical protein n=1 Tax=Nocardioides sp. Root190 TaxID=1736488 RepID=UPI0006F994BD|nr:hypothetical protein [Nocardioides sp. Root190]KRB76957.1 hypothetical protein ASE01_09310 [Nocardioides sp. Root190]
MDDADLGPLRKVNPSVVDDDPFWSVVRRRHPDVDLVLLPPGSDEPDEPGQPDEPPVDSSDAVRAVVELAREAWAALVPLLPDAGPPGVRWASRGDGHALLIVRSLVDPGDAGGVDLLRRAAVVLDGLGWRLAPTRRAGHPLLRATNGLVDFEGEAGPGATVLRIATGVLPVSEPDRAAVLEEAGSWR